MQEGAERGHMKTITISETATGGLRIKFPFTTHWAFEMSPATEMVQLVFYSLALKDMETIDDYANLCRYSDSKTAPIVEPPDLAGDVERDLGDGGLGSGRWLGLDQP